MSTTIRPHWSDKLLEDARESGRLPQRKRTVSVKTERMTTVYVRYCVLAYTLLIVVS